MEEVKEVNFYGDALTVIKRDETVYVPAKQVAQHLGLDWDTQRRRLLRSRVLSKGTLSMTLPSAGGNQGTLALRVDLLPAWFLMINESKVKESVRERLALYQEKAVQVLSAAFVPPHLKSEARIEAEAKALAQTQIPNVHAAGSALSQAEVHLQTLTAMVTAMRENNLEIQTVKTTIGTQGKKIGEVELTVTDHDSRIAQMEAYTTGAQGKTVITKAAADLGVDLSDIRDAQACGLIAKNLCKARGIEVEKVYHPYFPRGVNEYPTDIALEAVRIWKEKREGGSS